MSSTATPAAPSRRRKGAAPEASQPFKPPVSVGPGLDVTALPITLISVDSVRVVRNHRKTSGLDPRSIEQLAASIDKVGLMQPIGVAVNPKDGTHTLIYGERRWRAHKLLDRRDIPARVLPEGMAGWDDELSLAENGQRVAPTAVEDCTGVARLLDRYSVKFLPQQGLQGSEPKGGEWARLPKDKRDEVVEAVAAVLGKPGTWVRDRAYLTRLSPLGRECVENGTLPLEHAREISKVIEHADQDEVIKAVRANPGRRGRAHGDERAAPFEEVRRLTGKRLFSLAQVPWKLEKPFAGCAACVDCEFNSANAPGLFEHGGAASTDPRAASSRWGASGFEVEPKAGVCTNQGCFRKKYAAARAALSAGSGKAVAAAAKAPKAKKEAAAKTAAAEATPAFLKPAAMQSWVKERMERSKRNAALERAHPVKAEPPEKVRIANARRDAENKWVESMRARAKRLEPEIARALAQTPGAWALLVILAHAKPIQACNNGDHVRARKAVDSPAVSQLLGLLKAPGWDGILAAERQSGRMHGLIDPWYDGPSGFAEKLAGVLGIEVDPAPTIESYLPKELQLKPAAAPVAKPDKPAKPAKPKPAAKPRRAAPPDEPHDPREALDEEDGL